MTEAVSDVYDLTYPSPISLEKISSIVVAVDLLRKEILETTRLQKKNISVRNILPSLPSTIYSLLEEYVNTLRKSILQWQSYLDLNVFNRNYSTNILSQFDDFAWDWDGTIDDVRTAKRMMMCDQLTQDEKFKIACLYCFEDDIKQIWPSISRLKDLNKHSFNYCSEQCEYYWICYLRNELDKIPNPNNDPIDEFMIYRYEENRSAILYFWNRLASDSQSRVNICSHVHEVFARFILQKLNENHLDIFVTTKAFDFISWLLEYESTLAYVPPTLMYIRSKVDSTNFSPLIRKLLVYEINSCCKYFHYSIVSDLFNEIWNNAPQHVKRSVFEDVLNNDKLFPQRSHIHVTQWNSSGMEFLITVLQEAAFEQRNVFWRKNWPKLIFRTSVEDSVVIMKLSFRNENEITSFKENVMSIYENIKDECDTLLEDGMFNELNDSLAVCCLDEQKRKELKQRILRSNYVGRNSVLSMQALRNYKSLNEFIDDAFQGAADLGVEFRNQFTSSPVTKGCLEECTCGGDFVTLMGFVETFIPAEQDVASLKEGAFEHFNTDHVIGDSELYIDDIDKFEAFLLWSLGSDDEVITFKQEMRVKKIFRTMMQYAVGNLRGDDSVEDGSKPEFPKYVDRFLTWYFNKDDEKIDKFTKRYLDEFQSFAPRKRRRIV